MCLRKRSKQTVRGHWSRFPSDDTAALSSSWRTSCCLLRAVNFQLFHSGTLAYNTHTHTRWSILYLLLTTEPSGKIETKIAPNWSHTTPGGAGGGTCSWASMGGRRGAEGGPPVLLGDTDFVCFFTATCFRRQALPDPQTTLRYRFQALAFPPRQRAKNGATTGTERHRKQK